MTLSVNGGDHARLIPVTVTDTTPPSITCPEDARSRAADRRPRRTPGPRPAPTRCGQVTIGHTDDAGPRRCAGAGIIRTWTATDSCGNTATCTRRSRSSTRRRRRSRARRRRGPVLRADPGAGSDLGDRLRQLRRQVNVTHVGDSSERTTELPQRSSPAPTGHGRVRQHGHLHPDHHGPRHDAADVVNCPGSVTVAVQFAIPPANLASVTGTDNCSAT